MKKILLLAAICLIKFASFEVLAACPTGYACMLKDLKKQEGVIQTMQETIIENHYKSKITEPQLKEQKTEPPVYRDLLPFLPKYY